MRTKFLSIIASLLILLPAITSCLNSDDNYIPSSDDIITAFGLDTIYGVNYKFTIDQYGNADGTLGLIYNIDSVPFSADTIINKITIATLTTSGYITAGETAAQDTPFIATDSLDLSKTMETPLTIRVRSYDGKHIKEYRIEVRRHLVNPDSLVWGGDEQKPFTQSFSGGAVGASQTTKSVLLGDRILVFTSDGTNIIAYQGPSTGQWEKITTDLPPNSNAKVSSIINFKGKLYITTEDGDLYNSENGKEWTMATSTITDAASSSKVTNLITSFYNRASNGDAVESFIAGMIEEDGSPVFATANVESNGTLTWTKGNSVPEEFPVANICAVKSFKTATGMERAVLIGTPNETSATKTTPWFSLDGLTWAPMETIDRYSLPAMKRPSIIYYGKIYYAFGDDFSNIYTSLNGMVWEKVKKDFLFPTDKTTGTPIFEDRSADYSMVVDHNNYIWMIWNKGTNYSDEAWRGKLNKLGFLIQD